MFPCSTTENLAVFIWGGLKRALGSHDAELLYEVCVQETENNVFTYRGEVAMESSSH